MPMTGIC
jgi:hypothetical protein